MTHAHIVKSTRMGSLPLFQHGKIKKIKPSVGLNFNCLLGAVSSLASFKILRLIERQFETETIFVDREAEQRSTASGREHNIQPGSNLSSESHRANAIYHHGPDNPGSSRSPKRQTSNFRWSPCGIPRYRPGL